MTTPDSFDDHAPPRKRGAPKGNRNAWKHGKRSAAAKAERQAARARIVAKLPDPRMLRSSLARADAAVAHFRAACPSPADAGDNRIGVSPPQIEGGGDPPPHFSRNKTNNSVAGEVRGDRGTPSPDFSRNKTNNSVAGDGRAKRGAPKGNHNALKHGSFSGQREEFRSELRLFLRRLDATCRLANTLANSGRAR